MIQIICVVSNRMKFLHVLESFLYNTLGVTSVHVDLYQTITHTPDPSKLGSQRHETLDAGAMGSGLMYSRVTKTCLFFLKPKHIGIYGGVHTPKRIVLCHRGHCYETCVSVLWVFHASESD